jgi:stress-induced morphogen
MKTKALFYLKKSFIVTKTQLEERLRANMKVGKIEVVDTSGGCGSQFVINLKSADFNGKTLIAQHRMVNEILKEELKEIHSLQLKTEADKI